MTQVNDSDSEEGRKPRGQRVFKLILWSGAALVGFGLIAYALGPQLGSQPTSNKVKCANNLKQIGIAIQLYAQDHNGQFPDSFGTILMNEPIEANVFNCQSSDDTPAQGPTTQAVAADVTSGGHLSYIYLGRGLTTATVTPNTVLATEPLTHHLVGINVLFG